MWQDRLNNYHPNKAKLIKEIEDRHLPRHIINLCYLISTELSLLLGKSRIDFAAHSSEQLLRPFCFPQGPILLPPVHLSPPQSNPQQMICLLLHKRQGEGGVSSINSFICSSYSLILSNFYLASSSLLYTILHPHFTPSKHLYPLSLCFLPSLLPLIELLYSHIFPLSFFTSGKKISRAQVII